MLFWWAPLGMDDTPEIFPIRQSCLIFPCPMWTMIVIIQLQSHTLRSKGAYDHPSRIHLSISWWIPKRALHQYSFWSNRERPTKGILSYLSLSLTVGTLIELFIEESVLIVKYGKDHEAFLRHGFCLASETTQSSRYQFRFLPTDNIEESRQSQLLLYNPFLNPKGKLTCTKEGQESHNRREERGERN